MANQFQMAGAQSQKQKARKYAPIWVNRYVSGYWPNRNPLRDASLPVLQEKFYGALNDALIDGQDCEINNRSELVRRAGTSIFNNNTFGPQQRFYSFPVFGNNGTPYRRTLASSATQITDITNNGNSVLYLKPTGAQKTVFQAVGDTVFFSDTVLPKQLLNTTTVWQPNYSNFSLGTYIIDTNGNLQNYIGYSIPISSVAITVSGGVSTLSVTFTGPPGLSIGASITFTGVTTATFLNGITVTITGVASNTITAPLNAPAYTSTPDTGVAYLANGITGPTNFSYIGGVSITSNVLTTIFHFAPSWLVVGLTVTFNGITNPSLTFLNGTVMTISSITYTFGTGGYLITNVSGSYIHADVPNQTATNGYITSGVVSASTGSVQPTWSTSYLGITLDGNVAWVYSGPQVRNVGILPPTNPPNVANTPATATTNAWAASTYFFPGQVVYDPVTTTIQILTVAGTTNVSLPSFSATPGVTTNDGTAVWKCVGIASRGLSTTYNPGQYILATWNKTIISGYEPVDPPTLGRGNNSGNDGGTTNQPIYITVSYSAFYQCTVAGTTSGVATSGISWPLSGIYIDGSVTWTFIGLEVTRTASATTSPKVSNGFAAGNIGNSEPVSLSGTLSSLDPLSNPINDSLSSAGGAGFNQVISVAGQSGSTHPTWSTSSGGTTADGGATWINVGTTGTNANTQNWFYAYAYVSQSTPDISSASPISSPIIRAAGSWITISGVSSPDLQVDTIRIYRSLQQPTSVTAVSGNQLFWIADIPMPPTNTWDYVDSSNDPPDPNSTMNTFIIADTVGVNTPPLPQITNFVYYLGRLWGSVGNTVYASAGPDVVNGGNPFTAFSPENFMDFPSIIIRMIPSSQGLMVYTSDNVQIITGNGISGVVGLSGFTTFISSIYTDDISLANYDALTTDGSTTYLYTVDNNVISMSSSGLTWVSMAISNKLQNPFTLSDGTTVTFSPANVYLTWYVNGDDYGLLLSDGTYGYFRMMPSTAPDSGNMVWSPFSKITGGVSAVQYIETNITGQHYVLIGPGVSGPITKRDKNVNTDNGATFPWFATFGSIVLAHPNEIAMIQSIVVDSVFTGSHPRLNVWFDEINSSGTPYLYEAPESDPYTADRSTTTYADRFYMSDNPDAVAVCRHLQFSINFPSENFANTVLSTTIIGATEYDN